MSLFGPSLVYPGFTVCSYGVGLESIVCNQLDPSGKVSGLDEVPMVLMLNDDDRIEVSDPIPHEELGEYHIAIRLTDMDACGCYDGDADSKFVVEILVVSPKSCPKAIERADGNDDDGPLGDACNLIMYGTCAHVWQAAGDDSDLLLNQARKRTARVQMLLGFYLDQRQNQCGNTGWDFVRDHQ